MGIISRLAPSLRKAGEDEILANDPHPQLVDHEHLDVMVWLSVAKVLRLIAMNDLIMIAVSACIDCPVVILVKRSSCVHRADSLADVRKDQVLVGLDTS